MSLHEDLQAELKDAMKAKDSVRLSVVRSLLAAFTNELVATKRKPSEKLNDENALSVVVRETKKRKESIEQFTKGGRDDLAKSESDEFEILKKYLPDLMDKDEVRKVVESYKAKLGIDNKAQKGALIGAVMKELKGKADGGDVSAIVDEILS